MLYILHHCFVLFSLIIVYFKPFVVVCSFANLSVRRSYFFLKLSFIDNEMESIKTMNGGGTMASILFWALACVNKCHERHLRRYCSQFNLSLLWISISGDAEDWLGNFDEFLFFEHQFELKYEWFWWINAILYDATITVLVNGFK